MPKTCSKGPLKTAVDIKITKLERRAKLFHPTPSLFQLFVLWIFCTSSLEFVHILVLALLGVFEVSEQFSPRQLVLIQKVSSAWPMMRFGEF